MSDDIQRAVENLIGRATEGLVDAATTIMTESIIECPISDEETYVPQFRGSNKPPNHPLYLGDDPSMVGDNGTLRRSARIFSPIRTPTEVSITFGYGFGEEVNPAGRLAAEYAVPVHERGELRHDPPTKDHFLGDPLFANIGEFEATIAKEMNTPSEPFPAEQAYGAVIADGQDLGAT